MSDLAASSDSMDTSRAESDASMSERKKRILELADRLAPERNSWIRRNSYYYEEDYRYMRFLVAESLRVVPLSHLSWRRTFTPRWREY